MSTELMHLITITLLAVSAGVVGFVIGGMIEMHRGRRARSKRSSLEVVSNAPCKNAKRGAQAA